MRRAVHAISTVATVLAVTLFTFGCEDDPSYPHTPAELVIANAHTIERAVEAFARENNGVYPKDTQHESLAGHTLIDLLPGGKRLMNPYTFQRSVPAYYAALEPGDVGYWRSSPNAYAINGVGDAFEIIVLTKNYPDSILALELATVANCRLVQEAVEAFAAENNGVYPLDTSADVTTMGHSVVGLLPGGSLLLNPFTGYMSEPLSSGPATLPGETGYEPMHLGVGYLVTGGGSDYFGDNYWIVVAAYDPGCPTRPCAWP